MRVTMLGNDYQYAYAAQPSSISSALGYSYTYGAIDRAVQTLGADDYGQDNWKWYRQNTTTTTTTTSEAAQEVANRSGNSIIGWAANLIGELLDKGANFATAIKGAKDSVVTEEDKKAVDQAGKEIAFLAGLNTSGATLPLIVGGVAVTGLLIFAATRKKGRRR